ncbi:MAG TPA: ABC-2 transporter permease [Firmicutes bacterium]|nr:ABC-2 transporter permease [Bacillota bacterium]
MMRGLLRNDFMTMRKVILLYVAILAFYYILMLVQRGTGGNGVEGMQFIVVLFSAMIVIYSFSYGEKSGWLGYVNVLPVTRTQVVVSKYLMTVICMCAAAAGGMAIQAAVNLTAGKDPLDGLFYMGIALMGAAAFMSVVIPLLFWLGSERGRVAVILVFMIPFAVLLLMEKQGIRISVSGGTLERLMPVLAAGTMVLLAVSCLVSLSIYKHKEF